MRGIISAFLLTATVLLPAAAGAEQGTSVEFELTGADGSSVLDVTGLMATTAQPATVLWNDGTVAQDLPTFDYPWDPAVDLVQGSVERAAPTDPLTLRVKVAAGPDIPPKPYQWYRWAFHLEELWYFIEFTYVQNGATGGWVGSWYYCKLSLGSNCIHGDTPTFPVTWDASTRTITGRVPIADLAAKQPDRALEQGTMKPFSSDYRPSAGYKTAAILTHDRAPAFTPYELPIATVTVGVAPAGTPVGQVTFDRRATVTPSAGSGDVPFATTIQTAQMAAGEYEVFVKGCFGPCTVTSLPLTIVR